MLKFGSRFIIYVVIAGYSKTSLLAKQQKQCTAQDLQRIEMFECNIDTGYCIHKQNHNCVVIMEY